MTTKCLSFPLACDFNLPTTGVPGGQNIDLGILCRPDLPTLYLNYEETQTMMACKLAYGDTLESCKVTAMGSKYLYDGTWVDIWPNTTDQDIFSVDIDSSPELLLKASIISVYSYSLRIIRVLQCFGFCCKSKFDFLAGNLN